MKWQATLTRSKVFRVLLLRPRLRWEMLIIMIIPVIYALSMSIAYSFSLSDMAVILLLSIVGYGLLLVMIEMILVFIMYRQVRSLTDNGKVSYKLTSTGITTYLKGIEQKADLGMFSITLVLKDALITARKKSWVRSEGFIYFDSIEDRDKAYGLIKKYQDQTQSEGRKDEYSR